MGNSGEVNEEVPRERRVKRLYEPPAILSEAIFETTALACGKIFGQSFRCNAKPKKS